MRIISKLFWRGTVTCITSVYNMREFVEVKNEESRVKALSDIYIYIYIFFFFIITFIVQDEYYMCMLFTINSEFRLCSGLGKSKKL